MNAAKPMTAKQEALAALLEVRRALEGEGGCVQGIGLAKAKTCVDYAQDLVERIVEVKRPRRPRAEARA